MASQDLKPDYKSRLLHSNDINLFTLLLHDPGIQLCAHCVLQFHGKAYLSCHIQTELLCKGKKLFTVDRQTNAIYVTEQLRSFVSCHFFLSGTGYHFLQMFIDLNFHHAWAWAILGLDQKRTHPGSNGWPRCNWCDVWMRSSHCKNMSISVFHCFSFSHHCVCSKSTVSLLCILPFRLKKGAYVSSLSTRVLLLSNRPFIFSIFYKECTMLQHAQSEKSLDGMATHFQNGISVWQYICWLSLLSVCGPLAFFFLATEELEALILTETLDLNELLWILQNTSIPNTVTICFP